MEKPVFHAPTISFLGFVVSTGQVLKKTTSPTPCPDNGPLRGLIPPRNPSFPVLGSWPLSGGSWRPPSGRPSDGSLIQGAAPLASYMCLQPYSNRSYGGDTPRHLRGTQG
ncbi:hypothetical protein AOLI_G00124510 [Acnodon oligacanthus]